MSAQDKESKTGKRLTGVVVSRSSEQTIKVVVRDLRRHPLYKKTLKLRKYYLVHDANNTGQVGTTVTIQACKPYSKKKTWELVSAF